MIKSIYVRGVVVVCLLMVSKPSRTYAEEGASMGMGGGLDSSFSAGHSQQVFVEEFNQSLEDASSAEATPGQESAKPGELRFYKDLTVTSIYDSNIDLDFAVPKDDFYFIYTPTFGMIKGRKDVGKLYVQSFYDLSYLDYVENEKLSRFNHSWVTQVIYKTPKLKIQLFNNFQPQSARLTGDRTELRSGGAAQVVADANSFKLTTAYDVTPKFTLSHTYRYEFLHFASSLNANNRAVKRFSHQDHVFTPRLSYKVTPKNTVYTEYGFRTADYFQGGIFDSDSHTLSAGVLSKVTPKTGLNLEAGWRFREYSRTDLQDGDGLVFKAALTRKLSEKVSATFYATQDLAQSLDTEGATPQTQSTNQDQNFFGTTFNWKVTQQSQLSLDAAAGFSHRDGEVRLADPDNRSAVHSRERDEEIFGWGIVWKWNPAASTTALLSYRFVNKNSSFKVFEYEDHRVTGSLRMRF